LGFFDGMQQFSIIMSSESDFLINRVMDLLSVLMLNLVLVLTLILRDSYEIFSFDARLHVACVI